MGAIQYRREDHTLAVRRSTDGLQVVLGSDPIATSASATEAAVADLMAGLASVALPLIMPGQQGVLHRLVLELPRSLAAIPWERLVAPLAGKRLVVRLAAGRPASQVRGSRPCGYYRSPPASPLCRPWWKPPSRPRGTGSPRCPPSRPGR
jgi:hypothetical protein